MGGRTAGKRAARLFPPDIVRLLPILVPVTVAGYAAVLAAVSRLSGHAPSVGYVAGVGVLLAAAIFAEAFPVPVENLPFGRVSLAAIFILGAAMIYGWPTAEPASSPGLMTLARRVGCGPAI